MDSYVYLRGLRHADHTVFCVEDGQKRYWDPVFGVFVPFSSGQQVKRSIMDSIVDELKAKPSPITFITKINTQGQIGEGEVLSACDPRYVDQLLGGWMHAASKGKERTLKRRSPFSVSAMRPIHPLLSGLREEKISFDRSDKPHLHKVIVRDKDNNPLSDSQIAEVLKGTDKSLYRKWIQGSNRAYGLYIYDIAIDLRTLFCVLTNQFEPEIRSDMIEELRKAGWIESENIFGSCLVMPKEERERIIPAIAKSLINWRITSNQARTFSLMESLAIAVSNNANSIASALYARLLDDSEKPKAELVIETINDANVFIAKPCESFLANCNATQDALSSAEKQLISLLKSFDYEKQLT
jgi:hypothetical protein